MSTSGTWAPSEQPQRELRLEKLVLIVDSPEAQRLVATWETLYEKHDFSFIRGAWWLEAGVSHILVDWSELSRVDIDDAIALCPVLFENEILSLDGTVAQEALNYIRARMLDALQKPPR